jgi:uncharacterized protein YggE
MSEFNNSNLESESLPHALVRASRSVRYAATAALSLLALFLLVESISVIQSVKGYSTPYPGNTITVNGEGTTNAIPDTATVSFSANATANSVTEAQLQVTAVVTSALASVKAAGISDKDVTTDSFNVSPHYTSSVCPPGGMCPNVDSKIIGYDVSENISLKIHDTSKVSIVLDGLAKAAVSNVSGPNFVVGDTQAVMAQARAQAIQKAQVDAQKLATQLGVRLGKVVSYTDSDTGPNPQPMYKSGVMSADSAAAPTVPVGQNVYTKDVSVTYEIH